MSTDTVLRQAVRGALAVGAVGSMAGAGVALAQTAAPAASTATQLSKIVVTGSHIPQTAIATAQPIQTISRQEIDATGFTTVGQLLTNLPQAAPSINLVTTNNVGRSAGAVYLNIHNLGAVRLLVLVNGQRVAPGVTGAVDFSLFPLSIVQRVEVLLDGASPVYGTGAIAGVVNIITVKNYNGAEASAYLGAYDATNDGGGWDGKKQQYSFTLGSSGDRSGALLSVGYTKLDPIHMGNRTLSKYPDYPGFNGTLFDSSNVPQGRFNFLAPAGDPNLPPYANPSTCGPTGPFLHCSLSGPLNGPNANPHPFGPTDKYNFSPDNFLRDGEEKWSVYTQGHFDLTDNITFNANVLYNRRNTLLVGAASPLSIGATGILPQVNGLPIGIAGNNPYNPFGVDLVPFAPTSATTANPKYTQWCSIYGSGPGGTCTADHYYLLTATNRDTTHGKRRFNYQTHTFRFSGGFRGYFMMGGNQWTWNADYIYNDNSTTRISENLYDIQRLAMALGDVQNCPTASCVPYDFFSGSHRSDPNGVPGHMEEQANYVHYTSVSHFGTQLREYLANIAGNFFNSWYAGPWGIAAGYEYHVIDGQFQPDPLVQHGISATNGTAASNGRVGSNAQFVELQVPFGAGVPGFEKFNVDLATRWAQFKTEGTGFVSPPEGAGPPIPQVGRHHYAVNVSHVGIKWYPINSLLIRAAWTQGFRVPSVSELFKGGQVSYSPALDPCVYTPAETNGTCPTNATQPSKQIYTVFGGNSQLNPERSISRSLGFVYSPTWAPGLDVSADYYKVIISQRIGSVGPQALLNDCYTLDIPQHCDQITRVGGVVTAIDSTTQNLGSLHTNGWDARVSYKFPTTPVGQFQASLSANFVKFFTACNTDKTVCSNSAGTGFTFAAPPQGLPKHKFQFELDWSYGPWAATWRANLIGPMYEQCAVNALFGLPANSPTAEYLNTTPINGYARAFPRCTKPGAGIGVNPDGTPQSVGQNRMGTTIYHDIQASYTLAAWNTTFTLGVNNVFDKAPPITEVALQNPSYYVLNYRIPGRFFYGRISVRF